MDHAFRTGGRLGAVKDVPVRLPCIERCITPLSPWGANCGTQGMASSAKRAQGCRSPSCNKWAGRPTRAGCREHCKPQWVHRSDSRREERLEQAS